MNAVRALARGAVVLVAVLGILLSWPGAKVASSTVELALTLPAGSARPLPLDLARELREATLDRETIARLAEPAEGDSERIEAAAKLTRAVDVISTDSRFVHVLVSDTKAARAEQLSSDLAALMVTRAPTAVQRACAVEACTATARVTGPAVRLDLPMEPERFVAFGFGLLLALGAALVPVGGARSRPLEPSANDDEAPHTERFPPPPRPFGGTLPLAPAAYGSDRPPALAAGAFAKNELALGARRPPSDRPAARPASEPPAARPASEPPAARPASDPPAARPASEPPAARPASDSALAGSGASPIMGYAAPPGWHPDAPLRPGARDALALELRARSSDECVALAVSATPRRGEAKSALAVEIAIAASAPGDRRVLLVEADFKNPGIPALLHFEVPEAADFTSELARSADGHPGSALNVLICTPTLHVLPALASPTSEVVLTTHFESCLRMLRDYYDIVLVHAPLTSAGVYCTAIADVVDGAIVATGEGEKVPAPLGSKPFVKAVTS